MKKEELWSKVVERYPEFADDEHVLKQTSRGLRNLVFQAWEKGHEHGFKNGKAVAEDLMKRTQKVTQQDVFGGIFGNHGKG